MSRKVPFLAEDTIERDAEALLAEFSCARSLAIEPPIPIEDIVEKHLKLRIEFDDLHSRHDVPRPLDGDPEILGAIYGDGRIFIDESLDPDENPSKEGRYRFTVAHEGGGHWRLHQHLIRSHSGQSSLFDNDGDPEFLCRSSQKPPEEWQADFYASCLLMPRKLVFEAWDEMFPDRKRRVIAPDSPLEHPFVEVPRISCSIAGHNWTESVEEALDGIARPFAEKFLVSPIAMRIRLEKLGLLMREVPHQRILASE